MADSFAADDFASIARAMKGQPEDPVQVQETVEGKHPTLWFFGDLYDEGGIIDYSLLLRQAFVTEVEYFPEESRAVYSVDWAGYRGEQKEDTAGQADYYKDLADKTKTDILSELEFEARYREDADAPDEHTVLVIVDAMKEIEILRCQVEGWMGSGAQFHRNECYYRDMVDQIGAMLGIEAYTQDDGNVVPDVLRAKVVDLVRKRLS